MNQERLMSLAGKFGTPLYVYDENMIRGNYRRFYSAFKSRYDRVKVCYAYKANSNLAICHILRQEGAGADVLSAGELLTALEVGIKPVDIILTSTSKTEDEVKLAVDNGVTINIDSVDELKTVNETAKKKDRKAKISIRVNPGVDPETHPKIATALKESKFGLHIENDLAFNAYKLAGNMDNVKIEGAHMHIGSQILDVKPYGDALEKMTLFVSDLWKKLGIKLRFMDVGGGLGISYTGEDVIGPDDLAEVIVPEIKRIGYGIEIWCEPGRYIVGDAGVLLAEVQSVKETPYRKFINVDCGFAALLRPAMYDAYHRVHIVNKIDKKAGEIYDVAGNLCESGDILAKGRKLPKAEKGDLIAILDTGAYSFAMSSNYNMRPRPAEILIKHDGSAEIIREREDYEDMHRHQRVPENLLK